MAVSTPLPQFPPPGVATIRRPTADTIRAAIADASVGTIELAGQGTYQLDKGFLIDRPMRFVVPSGMTLRLADDATFDIQRDGASNPGGRVQRYSPLLLVESPDVTLEIHGTLDSNWDALYQDTPAVETIPETIMAIGAHRLRITGSHEIANSRAGYWLIDSDDVLIEGSHVHTPTQAASAAQQTFAVGAEGCYRLTVRDCTFDGVYEACDLNNRGADARFINCVTRDCERYEVNDWGGVSFTRCDFGSTRVEFEGSPATSIPRLSARPSVSANYDRPMLIIRDSEMVQTDDAGRGLIHFQERAPLGVTIDGLSIGLTASQSAPLIHFTAIGNQESRDVRLRNVRVDATAVQLTSEVLRMSTRTVDGDISIDVECAGATTNLLRFNNLLRTNVRLKAQTLGPVAASPVQVNFSDGSSVDTGTFVATSRFDLPLVRLVDGSTGSLRVTGQWRRNANHEEPLGLIDGGQDELQTHDRFADWLRSHGPTFWARSSVDGAPVDEISGVAGTVVGTVTAGPPGMVLSSPAQSIHPEAADSYIRFGDLAGARLGSGDFTYGILFRTEGTPDGRRLMSKGRVDASGAGWYDMTTRLTGGLLNADVFGGGTRIDLRPSGPNVTDDRWHFGVVSRRGDTVRLYVDGAEVASHTGATGVSSDTGEPLLIGASLLANGTPGNILGKRWLSQPFVINSRGLTAREVRAGWLTLLGKETF